MNFFKFFKKETKPSKNLFENKKQSESKVKQENNNPLEITELERIIERKLVKLNEVGFYKNGFVMEDLKIIGLGLDAFSIKDLSFLHKFQDLKYLHLRHNQIVDLSALSSLKDLEILYLDYNLIEDISCLNSLTKLVKLSLRSNNIRHFEGFTNLNNLEVFDIFKNEAYTNSLPNELEMNDKPEEIKKIENLIGRKLSAIDFNSGGEGYCFEDGKYRTQIGRAHV